MSSSSRYQSHLLNFLNRQSMRLREQVNLRWRQAKVLTVWGAQVLLYPAYAVFQTTRLVGRQIQQSVQQVMPRLRAAKQAVEQVVEQATHADAMPPALTADTPIQNTLQAVLELELPIAVHLPPLAIASAPDPLQLAAGQDPGQDPGQNTAIVPAASADITRMQVGELAEFATEPGAIAPHIISPSDLAQPGQADLATQELNTALDSSTSNAPARTGVLVQGMASMIATQALVLIAVGNQILDILTPQQQAHLQRRIAWELAGYWRSQRLLHPPQPTPQQNGSYVLPLPKANPHVLPPIRLVQRLMAWMQTSPVALAVNLFQESALVLRGEPDPSAIAPEQESWLNKDLLNYPLRALGLALPWDKQLDAELASLSIGGIIPVAPSPSGMAVTPKQTGKTTGDRPVRQRANPSIMEYLRQRLRFQRSTPANAALQDPDLTPTPLNSPDWSANFGTTGAIAFNAGAAAVYDAYATPNGRLSPQASSATSIDRLHAPGPSAVESQPDWIEANATFVGYEKHPLEQVLGWLDLSMLWLEDMIIKFWHWIRHRLQ